MSPDDLHDFERQLRAVELRRPPEDWQLLPPPVAPLFPRPLVLGLAACWAMAAGLVLTTPKDHLEDQPLIVAPGFLQSPILMEESQLLGSYEPRTSRP